MRSPRWARWLLTRLAEPERVDEVVGDLEEVHRRHVERRGRLWATVLTSLETLDMARALRRNRRAHSPRRSGWRGSKRLGSWSPLSWLDWKVGVRMLVRYPGMTLVAVAAMALGISIGATLYQFVAELVFPDHPYTHVNRIVGLENIDTFTGAPQSRALYDLGTWRRRLTKVEHLGARQRLRVNLDVGDGAPAPVDGVAISASAFVLAPTPPVLGRPLLADDEVPSASPVVVLSHELWQSRFRGDAEIVGRAVRIGGEPTTVVGVMPPRFELHVPQNDLIYPGVQELWVPFRLDPRAATPGEGPSIGIFGQLAAEVTAPQAGEELRAVGALVAAELPATHAHLVPRIATFSNPFGLDWIAISDVLTLLGLFIVAVMVALCASVALLLFARAAAREGEIVVRSALGASRSRIVSQLFVEALVLGAVALVAGWVGASLGLGWLVGVVRAVGDVAGVVQPPIDSTLSSRTMVYAASLALAGAVVAGVLPGLKITGRKDAGALQRFAGRSSMAPLGRLWGAIIVLQVALTTALMPFAFMLGLQAWKTRSVDRGFPAEEYLSVRLEMDGKETTGEPGGAGDEDFLASYETRVAELLRRLEGEPGVTGATASQLPGFDHPFRVLEVEGESDSLPDKRVQVAEVDAHFFEAMGARVVSGRGFRLEDQRAESNAVVVNESFTREILSGQNPVGRRLRYRSAAGSEASGASDSAEAPWLEIVGVVDDLTMTVDPTLDNGGGVYHPRTLAASYPLRIAVHVPGGAKTFARRLRELALETSPALRVYHPLTLDRAGDEILVVYRFLFRAVLLIGGFGLLLANAGIYAIMAFTVSRRRREIGVRVALGAGRRNIVAAILSGMARRVLLGVVLGMGPGLALAFVAVAGRWQPGWGSWALVVIYLALMAMANMAACLVPTRRALAIQPTEALAAEG